MTPEIDPALRRAVAHLDPPFGVLDAAALRRNIADLRRRSAGKPIRVATKSVRMRAMLSTVLSEPSYQGLLCYSLPEAIWLRRTGFRNLVVGYPTVHRAAIGELARDDELAAQITLMVDDPAQLDLIDAMAPPPARATIRICLELDAAFRPAGRAVTLGARRSPVRTPDQAAALARHIAGWARFTLVGLMAYEGQIAASATRVARPGHSPSAPCSASRLPNWPSAGPQPWRRSDRSPSWSSSSAAAPAPSNPPPQTTRSPRSPPARGFSGPRCSTTTPRSAPPRQPISCCRWCAAPPAASSPSPAAAGSPPVLPGPTGCRSRPFRAGCATSRPKRPGRCRLRCAGEPPAQLRIGDQVWFRHAKSGELCEHLDELLLMDDGVITDRLLTYRGEGKSF